MWSVFTIIIIIIIIIISISYLLKTPRTFIILQTRPYTGQILEFNNPISTLLEICRTK